MADFGTTGIVGSILGATRQKEQNGEIAGPNYSQELQTGNVFDFSKKHPQYQISPNDLTGGAFNS